MSNIALIGEPGHGKTFLAKNLIQKLQLESTKPSIIMLLVSFEDEWKPYQQNSDNTLYLKQGNRVQYYNKSKYDFKDMLAKMKKDAFSDDNKNKFKILFIDDGTTDQNNKSKDLLKIYTESRHRGITLIQALHYINSLDITTKNYIRDYIIFGPQVYDKIRQFYNTMMTQHFDRKSKDQVNEDGDSQKEDGYSFETFWDQLYNWMSPSTDEQKIKAFHNCVQIHLPSHLDPIPQIVFIEPDKQKEQLITTNAAYKYIK